MYKFLEEINTKPKLYSFYHPEKLWNDIHISQILLNCHIDENSNIASRKRDFIKKTVSFIDSRFKLSGKKILDLGCGPGLYCQQFASCGAIVAGIDLSERSINYAIKQAIKEKYKISYVFGDYTKLDITKKYDIITLIYCDLCALPTKERKLLLKKIYNSLLPGGVFIFDVFSDSGFINLEEHHEYSKNLHNGFWSDKEYYGFMNTFLYESEAVELGKYTIITRDSIKTIYNWLKYFKTKEIKRELKDAGFRIVEILGDLNGNVYNSYNEEFGVIAY